MARMRSTCAARWLTVADVIAILRELYPGAALDAAGPPVPIAPELPDSEHRSRAGPAAAHRACVKGWRSRPASPTKARSLSLDRPDWR